MPATIRTVGASAMLLGTMLMAVACGGPRPIQPAVDDTRAIAYGNIAVNGYLSEILFAKLGEVYVGPFKQPPKAQIAGPEAL